MLETIIFIVLLVLIFDNYRRDTTVIGKTYEEVIEGINDIQERLEEIEDCQIERDEDLEEMMVVLYRQLEMIKNKKGE